MIRVNRKLVSLPPDLADDGLSAGAKERKKAAEFYADPNNLTASFGKFSAYKKKSVVRALNDLFHGKCAYCESVYAATQPMDVEHFRPKNGVVVGGALKRPHYYWLAATWENLLPSCIDCNRERKQEFIGGSGGSSGKENLFPLTDEKYRARNPKDMKREARARLLLDPCADRPDKHLSFKDDGEVEALKSKGGRRSRRGEASIKVFGLNRLGLGAQRAERARETLAAIKRIKRLEQKIQLDPNDHFGFKAELQEEMGLLKGYWHPKSRYAAMVRQLVIRHYGPMNFDD